jgi:hypothetical protein
MLTSSACLTRHARLAPAGSPVFTARPLNACRGSEPRKHHKSLALMAVVLRPSPLGERVGGFVMVQLRGYASRSLGFRPTVSRSTLRLVHYRTRHQTRDLTAGEAVSGSPSQPTGPAALARRHSHTTGPTAHVSDGSVDAVRVNCTPTGVSSPSVPAVRSSQRPSLARPLAGCYRAAPLWATTPLYRSGLPTIAGGTMPSADFCRAVREDSSALSPSPGHPADLPR